MSGTGEILSVGPSTPEFIKNYLKRADEDFVAPSGFCELDPAGCTLVAVYTPSQIRPLTGLADMTADASVAAGLANLDDCLSGASCVVTLPPYTNTGVQKVPDKTTVVYGRSQSSISASLMKARITDEQLAGGVNFLLDYNPGRPNGGLLARFPGAYIPILGISFTGATRTDSSRTDPLLTVDAARQYDFWTDFPVNPLNLLAVANAVLGGIYLHHHSMFSDGPAQLQGYYQDTTYLLGPTSLLPLVTPLATVPVIGTPLALALDPPLRVLVETGYDRTINPGQPTTARLLFPNPLTTLADVALAIPTGWDDAISYMTDDPANRPFHTSPQPVYGVGGPPVYAGAVDPYGTVNDPTAAPAARPDAEAISVNDARAARTDGRPQTPSPSPSPSARPTGGATAHSRPSPGPAAGKIRSRAERPSPMRSSRPVTPERRS